MPIVTSAGSHTPHPVAAGAAATPLLGIQYLRAAAALMVVCYHMTIQVPAYVEIFRNSLLGRLNLASGVDVFFVVSGFIMMVSSRRATPGDFVVRRLIRILPLYWLLTAVVALLATVRPELFRSTVVDTEYLLKSLFFVPYANPAQANEMRPILVPGWSLNFEMFFYAVFAAVLLARYERRLYIAAGVFSAVLLARPLLAGTAAVFFADLRLIEFWAGMLLAAAYTRGQLTLAPPVARIALVAASAWLLWGLPWSGAAGGAADLLLNDLVPATVIVGSILCLERAGTIGKWPRLELLGDASYSIYLSHILSLGLLRVAWVRAGLAHPSAQSAWLFAGMAMIVATLLALIVYRGAELPLTTALQRQYRRHRAPMPPAGARMKADGRV